jgi:hypothetical protein
MKHSNGCPLLPIPTVRSICARIALNVQKFHFSQPFWELIRLIQPYHTLGLILIRTPLTPNLNVGVLQNHACLINSKPKLEKEKSRTNALNSSNEEHLNKLNFNALQSQI